MKTTKAKPQDYIYQALAFNQVAYLNWIFLDPYLSIKSFTLTAPCDFFIYTFLNGHSHDL